MNIEKYLNYKNTKDKEEKKKHEEELIKENRRLIDYTIKHFFINQNIEDIYQMGYIGLLRALRLYDINIGVKFSTFAVSIIRNEITNGIRKTTGLRVTEHREKNRILVDAKITNQKLIPPLSTKRVLTRAQLDKSFEYTSFINKCEKNQDLQDNNNLTDESSNSDMLLNQQVYNLQPTGEDFTEEIINREAVRQILSKLSEKERYILETYYGINRPQKSLKEIAEETGNQISDAGVSYHKQKIIKRIRRENKKYL